VRRSWLIAGGAGLAALLVLFNRPPVDGDAGAPARAATSAVPVASSIVSPRIDARSSIGLASASTAPSALLQPLGAAAAARITVAGPQRLHVGDMDELVVSVEPGAKVGEISFTVQFDANVLQVRAGTEGDWAAATGAAARFAADISSAEDRVRVRSVASGARLASAGGNVAVVQFQAVAPGSTWVLISDVTVKDPGGNSVPFALSASSLQVTAESSAPRVPQASIQPLNLSL